MGKGGNAEVGGNMLILRMKQGILQDLQLQELQEKRQSQNQTTDETIVKGSKAQATIRQLQIRLATATVAHLVLPSTQNIGSMCNSKVLGKASAIFPALSKNKTNE